jgi:hypothetical protein
MEVVEKSFEGNLPTRGRTFKVEGDRASVKITRGSHESPYRRRRLGFPGDPDEKM